MSDNTNICLPCGLCCDGTLIGFVKLEHEELPRLRALMEIEEEHGEGFILHPCKSFCGECTIYADRPKQCDLFKCGLLESFKKKELDYDSAIDIIEAVREKRNAIVQKVEAMRLKLKSQSFYFGMSELEKWLQKSKSESTLTPGQRELMSDINQLNGLLTKRFGLSLFFTPPNSRIEDTGPHFS